MAKEGKGAKKNKKVSRDTMEAITAKHKENRAVRQKKREEVAQKKVLRRAAEGNVHWETKPNEQTGGFKVTFAKGGPQSLLRKMLKMGLLKQEGKKLVPA